MPRTPIADSAAIHAVRRFNRFYTQRIGVLEEGLDQSPFTLAEARVMYEVAHGRELTASRIAADLGMDPGYLSRLIATLGKRGLIKRERSRADARHSLLSLTPAGKAAFKSLDRNTTAHIGRILAPLAPEGRHQLASALRQVRALLGEVPDKSYLLRTHQPGDIGWIVERHGALYASEYQWDGEFEALVAEIGARFLREFDPRRERCWIAERDGVRVGSVMLVKRSETIAQLRLLLVEPSARGLGIGKRLVDECIRFARMSGYRRISLWTNSVLHAARHLYEEAGFELVDSESHRSFGHDLVSQTWERAL